MRIDETSGSSTTSEQVLSGIGVSPGIAIGPAYVGDRGELPVSESRIDKGDIENERARFAEAVATSTKQLRKLKTRATALPGSAADEIGYVLDAHLAMLANPRRSPAHRPRPDQRRACDPAGNRGDRQDVRDDARPLSGRPHRRHPGGRG